MKDVAYPTVLVTGARGLLGRDVVSTLDTLGFQHTALDHKDLNICDPAAVDKNVAGHDWVINCAAYTAVDQAETDEASAFETNALGPATLAKSCAGNGARLLQVSTDYVFGGTGIEPHATDDSPQPSTAYGRSKLAGEWAVMSTPGARGVVLRTAWLYGAGGTNFVTTIAGRLRQRGWVDVVNDQFGQPTWSSDLAHQVVGCLSAAIAPGIYHATNSGSASWFDLAQAVAVKLKLPSAAVRPVPSSKFQRAAPRPSNSVLSHACWDETGVRPMRPWRDAFEEAWPTLL